MPDSRGRSRGCSLRSPCSVPGDETGRNERCEAAATAAPAARDAHRGAARRRDDPALQGEVLGVPGAWSAARCRRSGRHRSDARTSGRGVVRCRSRVGALIRSCMRYRQACSRFEWFVARGDGRGCARLRPCRSSSAVVQPRCHWLAGDLRLRCSCGDARRTGLSTSLRENDSAGASRSHSCGREPRGPCLAVRGDAAAAALRPAHASRQRDPHVDPARGYRDRSAPLPRARASVR